MHLISITKQQLEHAGFTLCTVSRNEDDVDERWKINNTNFVWSDSHNRRTVSEETSSAASVSLRNLFSVTRNCIATSFHLHHS